MIIPVRCFTCGKVLGDKWNTYKKLVDKKSSSESKKKFTLEDITISSKNDPLEHFDNNHQNDILNKMNIKKMCCRRHMLSHIDLIDII
tara:strand:+ start:342 stop:605 length:264 start_codon:yes stop_codon:yes gene_type:complete